MTADLTAWERSSVTRVVPPLRPRKLAKVPFVELADGRLQGVVSSGSDIERVYVSSIAAGDLRLHCSTNNNRPCGGLTGYPCKHLRSLVDEAVVQYGVERVARYLRVPTPTASPMRGAAAVHAGGQHSRPRRPPCSAASCATWPTWSCRHHGAAAGAALVPGSGAVR